MSDSSALSLYYYRARYYDTTAGRFLSEDPIGFKGGVAFYPYVSNSPTNRSDPFGLFPTWWHRQVTADLGRVGFGPKCISKAQQVAEANAAVDDYNHGIGWGPIGSTVGFFQFIFHSGQGWASPGPHFPDKATLDHLHDKALTTCSLKDLGESLHSRQDSIAHGGWSSFDHYTHLSAPDNLAAGSDLAIGAMNDTINQLSEFKAKCLQCCQ
jgi:RHS repeat-associated protein